MFIQSARTKITMLNWLLFREENILQTFVKIACRIICLANYFLS